MDDFQEFFQSRNDKLPVREHVLEAAQTAGSQFGFDLFKQENQVAQLEKGLSASIRWDLTEETTRELRKEHLGYQWQSGGI